jgi:hypothetical protein
MITLPMLATGIITAVMEGKFVCMLIAMLIRGPLLITHEQETV